MVERLTRYCSNSLDLGFLLLRRHLRPRLRLLLLRFRGIRVRMVKVYTVKAHTVKECTIRTASHSVHRHSETLKHSSKANIRYQLKVDFRDTPRHPGTITHSLHLRRPTTAGNTTTQAVKWNGSAMTPFRALWFLQVATLNRK